MKSPQSAKFINFTTENMCTEYNLCKINVKLINNSAARIFQISNQNSSIFLVFQELSKTSLVFFRDDRVQLHSPSIKPPVPEPESSVELFRLPPPCKQENKLYSNSSQGCHRAGCLFFFFFQKSDLQGNQCLTKTFKHAGPEQDILSLDFRKNDLIFQTQLPQTREHDHSILHDL